MKPNNQIKCVLFLILFSFQMICGQQENNDLKKMRSLGGHYFTISNALGSPFILTSLTTSLGAGGVNDLKYEIPFGNDEEGEKYLQGDLTLALLAFEYQHAIKDWLAVYFGFDVNTRLGSDYITLFKEGINYSASFNIGWLVKIIRSHEFALSGSIQVNNGSYSIISIENYADDIINGDDDASLITDKYSTTGEINFNASYGISHFVGLNGNLGIGYGESIQENQGNEVFSNVGIELDMNFTQMINTPISIIIGYRYSSFPATGNMIYFDRNILFTQLSYIGREDLILSLNLAFSKESSNDSENIVWPNTFKFNMKYLF